MKALRGILAALAVAGCGAPVSSAPVDSGVDSGQPIVDAGTDAGLNADAGPVGADAGFDAGPPVDAGTPCVDKGSCTVKWLELASVPVAIDHHTTFVHTDKTGTWLHAVGGVANFQNSFSAMYDVVLRSKLDENGLPGAWETMFKKLSRPRAFHAMAVSGDRVVILGGISQDSMGPYATDTVEVGTLDNVGMFSWKAGPSLGYGALHPSAVILGNTVVITGGTGAGNQPQALVKTATLESDGTLSAWTMGPPLPTGRSHHTSVVYDGHVYLFGGFNPTQQPLTDILRSRHDATGAIEGWDVVGTMVDPPWTAGATVLGNSIVVVGGGQGGPGQETYLARVRRAEFDADGKVTEFKDMAPLPTARAHVHQAPIHDGHIYSVGGRLAANFQSMDQVFVGTFGR